MTSSRVAWSEGLFLRPQHFQQSARYHDRSLQFSLASVVLDAWGFSKLNLDADMLMIGKVGITSGAGRFPDGEIFDFPDHDKMPVAVSIPEESHGKCVYLSIPPRRLGDAETSLVGDSTRLQTQTIKISDTVTEDRTALANVEVARLVPSLRLEPEEGVGVEGYVTIPVARILDVSGDGAVKLDPAFIPTVLGYAESRSLKGFAINTLGLLEGRATLLAARVTGVSSGGAPEVSDYILLQTINLYISRFRALVAAPSAHPRDVYITATELCAELATFTQPNRLVPDFPTYSHRNLTRSFKKVADEVRRCLSYIGDPTAVSLSLQDRGYGIHVSEITDSTLLTSAQIVLAVGASMASEDLRKRFPSQVKIGSADVIRDLVNVQIPGVRVLPLPVAPRQIPYHAGKVYFELERKGDYWQGLVDTSAIAIHVGGRFPGLGMKLWAIREVRG